MYFVSFITKIIREREFRSLFNEFWLKIKTFRWQQKHQAFNDYYVNRQWNQAIEVANNILASGPVDPELYRKLANSYIKVNNSKKAQQHMKTALKLTIKLDKKELIQRVEQTAFADCLQVESSFTYLGGGDNLGFVHHLVETEAGKQQYLTKIIPTVYPYNHFAEKEQYFHQRVRPKKTELQQTTLEIINAVKMKQDQLLLLTFPKRANNGISQENFEDLIQINKKIASSLPAQEVERILSVTNRGKADHICSLMHKRSTHVAIFQKMRNKIHHLEQQEELQQLIMRFEQIILTSELYRKLDPAEDYMFSHGDFNGNNILYDHSEKSYYIIDWSSYDLALKGYDLAKLFASYRLPFKAISDNYLALIFAEDKEDWLGQVFFIYHLLILWIDRLDLENVAEQITEYIAPAANYIEKLVSESKEYLRERDNGQVR